MKAISLWQPWASLVALKVKTVETRCWYTDYRGDLLICAAKTMNMEYQDYYYSLPSIPMLSESKPVPYKDLPRGYAVAKVSLTDCIKMTETLIDKQSDMEIACGNWEIGRYAWMLGDITPVTPFPVRGQQKLFEVEYD
jgi:activating signal cointegrator 1